MIFHNNFLHIKRVTKLGNFGEDNRAIGKNAVCGMDLRIYKKKTLLWPSTIKRENHGQTRILFMVEVGVF